MRQQQRAGRAGGLLLLLVLFLLFTAGRGTTARQSHGDYANDLRVTANGVYRFKRTGIGAGSATDYQRIRFLDTYNKTSQEIVLTLYRPAGSEPATVTVHYVPANTPRDFPGMEIDSVAVSGTFGVGEAFYMGGFD